MHRPSDLIPPEAARTLPALFRERVRRSPEGCAYRRFDRDGRCCETTTWAEVERQAARWQAALRREGVQAGDRVALMLRNSLEWVLFDLASLGLGLVTVPLYFNDRPENFAFILEETGARVLLIENTRHWELVREVRQRLGGVVRIVAVSPVHDQDNDPRLVELEHWLANGDGARVSPEYERRARHDRFPHPGPMFPGNPARNPSGELRSTKSAPGGFVPEGEGEQGCRDFHVNAAPDYAAGDDAPGALASIIYTSGTTGRPKGVMLSHANILSNAHACASLGPLYPDDLFLSFLPLSHALERTVGYYLPILAGACVAHVRSLDKLPEDLAALKPTVMVCVPRIFERIHQHITGQLAKAPRWRRELFNLTIEVGWRRFLHRQGRGDWSAWFLLWPLLDWLVAARLRAALGGRARLAISGGAPLSPEVARVFLAVGLTLLQGYGLTETSPVVSANTADDNRPDTVGKALAGVEVRLAENGELLIRGPCVMPGYWRNPAATQAAIDPEGWFHSGDVASIDADGFIAITGRIKEIIVLANGEKVPPADLELAITADPLFEQVLVVGEGRPFLAALVVLNADEWERLAQRLGIDPQAKDIPPGGSVEQALLERIGARMARFPGYARIRRVGTTRAPWEASEGLLTATLKIRRDHLLARFAGEIDSLYAGY